MWPLKYVCTIIHRSSVDANLQSKINSQILSKSRAFRQKEYLMLSDHGIPQEWKNLLGWGREEGRWQRTWERTQFANAGSEEREMVSQSMIKWKRKGSGRVLLCWHLDSTRWALWWTASTVTLTGSRINQDMGSGHGCGARTWLLVSWCGQGILKCAWQRKWAERQCAFRVLWTWGWHQLLHAAATALTPPWIPPRTVRFLKLLHWAFYHSNDTKQDKILVGFPI